MLKNKEGKVRSGWKIAAMLGIALAIATFFGTIIYMFPVIYLTLKQDIDLVTQTAYSESGQKLLDMAYAVAMLIQEIAFILTPVIIWKFFIKRPLSNMGLTPIKRNWKDFLIGLLFGIVSMALVFGALLLTGNTRVVSWKPHFSWEQLIYLGIFIFVGFAEEISGRGYIMSALRQTQNLPVIILVSSIIFALLHSANSGMGLLPYINLTLVGVLFAYMFVKSGNIWMPIGYHITWNYFQGYVFGFKVSGTDTEGIISTVVDEANIFNGGAFGPEGGLYVTTVILLGLVFVWFFYRKLKFDFLAMEP